MSDTSIEKALEVEPPRLRLANIPTRGHWLRYSARAELAPRIWVKRDDQTGSELSGNKVRKLEYLMAEAVANHATHLITCGGEQSNHARTTAMVAAQLGMRSVLVLHTDDPAGPPAASGNLLLDRLAGAEIRWVSHAAWRERKRLLADEAERVRSAGGTPYLVPEGGSNALGSWGYIRAAHELAGDLRGLAAPDHPATVVCVCGSAGTAAGLILGAKLLGFDKLGIRIAGVNVRDARPVTIDAIGRICAEFEQRWPLGVHVTTDDIDVLDGLGAGYARSLPEELATIRDVCRSDGIVLDPVYTGKAFHRMVMALRRDPERFGKAVVFLHSGGTFGLFAAADTVAQVL